MASESAAAFAAAISRLESCGGYLVNIDFSPFAQTAALLYQSSFVAERYSGIRPFLDKKQQKVVASAVDGPEGALVQQRSLINDDRLLPVTRAIIAGAGEAGLPTFNHSHPGAAAL